MKRTAMHAMVVETKDGNGRGIRKGIVGIVVAAMVTVGMLAGCSSHPSAETVIARVQPKLLAVPGVTGGTLKANFAEFETLYKCEMTTDETDPEAMKGILKELLVTAAQETRDVHELDSFTCYLSNGDTRISNRDIGVGEQLKDIRTLI